MMTKTKSADRIALEAEAERHGVEVREWMSDRALRIAVAEKLMPGVFPFTEKSDTHVQRAFELALDGAAAKAAALADQQAAALAAAPRGEYVNGAPRADTAAVGRVSSSAQLRQRRGIPEPRPHRPAEAVLQVRADAALKRRGGPPPVRSSAELAQRLRGSRP